MLKDKNIKFKIQLKDNLSVEKIYINRKDVNELFINSLIKESFQNYISLDSFFKKFIYLNNLNFMFDKENDKMLIIE